MLFKGIANPEQLKALTAALDEYCRATGTEPGTPAHEEAASHVMALFNAGVLDPVELLKALHTRRRPTPQP